MDSVEDESKPAVKELSLKGKYENFWNEKPIMAFGADNGWKPFVTFNGAVARNNAPIVSFILARLLCLY